jgi:hypothetical protein
MKLFNAISELVIAILGLVLMTLMFVGATLTAVAFVWPIIILRDLFG